MNIWALTTIFLGVVVVFLSFCLRNDDKRIEELNKWNKNLIDTLNNAGTQGCCVCGKPYNPLNDPEYSPELNLCRDCMWKMYYHQTFGEDDS